MSGSLEWRVLCLRDALGSDGGAQGQVSEHQVGHQVMQEACPARGWESFPESPLQSQQPWGTWALPCVTSGATPSTVLRLHTLLPASTHQPPLQMTGSEAHRAQAFMKQPGPGSAQRHFLPMLSILKAVLPGRTVVCGPGIHSGKSPGIQSTTCGWWRLCLVHQGQSGDLCTPAFSSVTWG